jgi:PHD/YefM family antitoxin component YafN of YafNO toxin-antitoxin module
VAEVKGMEDVRASLPSILATFRETPDAEPVHFGSHRRDEAVLLSRSRYERQIAAERELEELERLGAIALVHDRLADGRFSEGTVDDLFEAVDERT